MSSHKADDLSAVSLGIIPTSSALTEITAGADTTHHSTPTGSLSGLSCCTSTGASDTSESQQDDDDDDLEAALMEALQKEDAAIQSKKCAIPSSIPESRVPYPRYDVAPNMSCSAPLSDRSVVRTTAKTPTRRYICKKRGKECKDKETSGYEQAFKAAENKSKHPLMHRDKDRDQRWACLRVLQARRYYLLFTRDGDEEYDRGGFITEAQAAKVDELCKYAAFEAVNTPNSKTLETGSAALWACALVQEVWARDNQGWKVASATAASKMSLHAMEEVCKNVKGWESYLPEVHAKQSVQDSKTKRQLDEGVRRKFSAHSFGTHDQKLAKLQCLDSLLLASGEEGEGLHSGIMQGKEPLLLTPHQPGPKTERVQAIFEERYSRFSKKKASL